MKDIFESARLPKYSVREGLQSYFSKDKPSKTTLLLKRSAGIFALKTFFTGLLFLFSLLLARLLGAAGYGVYAYAIAWVNLLTVVASMGLDALIVREIAAYEKRSAWDLARGLLQWASLLVLSTSFGLVLLGRTMIWVWVDQFDEQMITALQIALILFPFMTFVRLIRSMMRGFQQVVIAQIPEMVLQPLLFGVLVGGVYLVDRDNIKASWMVGLQVIATGITFLIAVRQLQIRIPKPIYEATPHYQSKMWFRSALVLLIFGSMTTLNARVDTIMLGAIRGAEEVGLYVVASRGAELILFVMIAVNTALGPTIARLYMTADIVQLQRITIKSARMMLLGALPIATGLVFFGYWFLYLFGPAFTQGQISLIILSIAQLINTVTGPLGLLLIMTGHESVAARGFGIGGVANIFLNMLLIPSWGMNGAATATATSMIISDILLAVLVYKKLGIHATALGTTLFQRTK